MFWIVSKREKAGAATFGRVSPLRLFGCGEVWGGEGEDWIVGGYLDLFRKKVLSGSVWGLCRGFNGSIGMILEEKIPEIIVYIVIGNAHIH